MEGHPTEPVPGAAQVPLSPTEGVGFPAPPSIESLPEGFTTVNNFAEAVGLDTLAPEHVRDIVGYLGLAPVVVRGDSHNLVRTFSPDDAKTVTDFVSEQTRPL